MWSDICKVSTEVQMIGPDFTNLYTKEVTAGHNTRFWEDPWIQGEVLKTKFSRLYDLDPLKDSIVADKLRWERGNWNWKWSWRIALRGRAEGQFHDLLSLLLNFAPTNCKGKIPSAGSQLLKGSSWCVASL